LSESLAQFWARQSAGPTSASVLLRGCLRRTWPTASRTPAL